MTLSNADFLASNRIVVVQSLAQMQQMEVSELPEGALIQVAQYNPVPVANNFIGSLYRFTRAVPSVGSLVFGVANNLLDAVGDGFFYRYPQRGVATLVNGTFDVTGVWLGSDFSPPVVNYALNYVGGSLVNAGILRVSTGTQIQFTITSSSNTDGSSVMWTVFQ
jgi:hypothetical protein